MMLKDLKGKKQQLPPQCFCKEKKNTKITLFWGGGTVIRRFVLFMGIFEADHRGNRDMSVHFFK
jgi:hypothetical protein